MITLEQENVSKAEGSDFGGRWREIISDPLNLLIDRDFRSGLIDSGGYVCLHNGNRVPISGENSYYKDYSKILEINRGVHEPLEEFCFQETLKKIKEQKPVMIELGSYWAHYSMWFLKYFPEAKCCMVEADEKYLSAGLSNFQTNGFHNGQFIHGIVGNGDFKLDTFSKEYNIEKVTILHSDIQGYELQMLDGASDLLTQQMASYIFLSTHSQKIHEQAERKLKSFGYGIEVSSDFDHHTTSYDGFILATSPSAKQVFENFCPFGRGDIMSATSSELLKYLSDTLK